MNRIIRHITLVIVFNTILTVIHGQVYLSPGSQLTIKNGTSLYIGTDLTLKSTSTSSGYLVDQTMSNNVTITGNILVERYLSPDDWHNISAPLSNATHSQFTGTDLVFSYNESLVMNDWNFGWVWHTGALSTMKGYDVFVPLSAVTVQYTSSNPSDLHSGSFTTGVTITNVADGETPDHKGWNLIGNPYPSPIDWLIESAWNKTAINDAKYIWDPVGEIYTIFIGGGSPVGLNGGTQFVPSNQGFWVQAVQNGTISVNNASRIGLTASTPDYYKEVSIDYPLLKIQVAGNDFKDETIIRFIEGATDGFDRNLDALKLFTASEKVPQLYSKSKVNDLAINTLDRIYDGLVIPLFMTAHKSGIYALSVCNESHWNQENKIYLNDVDLGTFTNVDEGFSYSFYTEAFEAENRFKIIFNPSEEQLNTEKANYEVYTTKSSINIHPISTQSQEVNLNIYNMLGQIVSTFQTPISKSFSYNPALPSGNYILEIVNGNQSSKFKINLML